MSDDGDDLGLNWNKHEWQQYYRLRYVVGELTKALCFTWAFIAAYFANKWATEAAWDGWAVWAATGAAFFAAFIALMQEMDLDRD